MDYGFVKVAAGMPTVSPADCRANAGRIEKLMRLAADSGVQMITFPELSLTGYTCLDLFANRTLLDNAANSLPALVESTSDVDIFAIVGVPLVTENRLVNAAVAFLRGEILGVVPKTYLPNGREYQERRWFASAYDLRRDSIIIGNRPYPIGNLIFSSSSISTGASYSVAAGIEICEDLWTPVPPSSLLAMEGANIIFNPSASNELTGKHHYRRSLVSQQSARCISGYVYANAGYGESTTDLVFAGGGIIAENGIILNEGGRFATDDQLLISEIDISNLDSDRRTNTGFMQGAHLTGRGLTGRDPIRHIPFTLPNNPEAELTRTIDPHPFIPSNNKTLRERERKEILDIQVAGLSRRIEHIHARTVVIGVSGGLDSTLALMVAVMTFDALGRARDGILAITMPGFGTSRRTYDNAVSLAGSLGVTLRSISIGKACQQHFEDIGHDPSVHDTTYENIQARERTQILMDIANREGGLVIGTGDLSELALGWATFNGDHMSMYGLNAGIPKTLVRHLVEWIANNKVDKASRATLLDITLTPISPELIPDTSDTDTTNTKSPAGAITQKTEDLVGPYELHDFFLYHFLRYGSTPAKIAFLAGIAFRDRYEASVIDHWLHVFLGRFFAQQYKRNCLPDGPKVGSVSLSPRGDWRMSSDISPTPWLDPVE